MSKICRTCCSRHSKLFYALETLHEYDYENKTLGQMLKELMSAESSEQCKNLSSWICGNCCRKLKNAYGFVVQAVKAQRYFLEENLASTEQVKQIDMEEDCLDETPVPMQLDDNTDCNTTLFEDSLINIKVEQVLEADDTVEPISPQSIIFDPLVPKLEMAADSNTSSDELDDIPLTILKRKEIKSKALKQSPLDSCSKPPYKCEQCSKSYKYLECLRKHAKKHENNDQIVDQITKHEKEQTIENLHETKNLEQKSKNPETVNLTQSNPKKKRERLKDVRFTDFNLQLCKPNGCKSIKCMICLLDFAKLSELRNHFNLHPTDITFEAHGHPIGRIAEGFYRNAVESTEEGLKNRILNDLDDGNYSRYYSITNEAGYEMSLDSSDTDGDEEHKNYTCDLCPKKSWPRKYLLYEHHKAMHSWIDAPHPCRRCGARFLNSNLLSHHLSTQCYNALKRYRCEKCPLRFFWRQNLYNHNKLEHKNKRENFQCDKCPRCFLNQHSYTRHMLLHEETTKLIPCRWCTRSFYRMGLYHKHLKRHGFEAADIPLAETLLMAMAKPVDPKTILCKLCDHKFDSLDDLRNHISMHPKSHSTDACNYIIATNAGIEIDLNDTDCENNEGAFQKSYKCNLCGVSCKHRHDMLEHQYAIHTFDKMPFSCEHCIFKSVDKRIMDYHLRSQCLNKEKPFSCPQCRYKFQWEENLQLHISTRHADAPETAGNHVNKGKTTELSERYKHKCPHCVRAFVLQISLEKHIRDMHVVKRFANSKVYLCSLCGLKCTSQSKLDIHMKRHNKIKPFKCDHCDMRFTVFYELKVHQRKHTGERPYHCTLCGKNYSRINKWKKHALTHRVNN